MLLGSRSQEGSDELNVGFQESVLFGLETLQRERQSLCCCPASQCKIFLLLSSPAVSIGPCGEQGSCVPLLLDHADMVNCTSGGPGLMKCFITRQRGSAPSGQQWAVPQAHAGELEICGHQDQAPGRDSMHAPSWLDGGKAQFLNHLKGKWGL